MLAFDLVVAGTSVSQTYSFISSTGTPTSSGSLRRDATAPLDSPETFVVKHENVTKGTLKSDRHLIRVERVKPQATSLLPVMASAHIVIDAPRDTFTAAEILDLVDQIRSVCSAGNVAKFLNGES